MCKHGRYYRRIYKKKLNSTILKTDKSEDFAEQYTKAVALLRFYFNVSNKELKKSTSEDFENMYSQLKYALEFDAVRASGDPKKKLSMPL